MNSNNFYNRISPIYGLINFFLSAHKTKLIKAVNSIEPGKLLEVGIGHGKYVKRYKGHTVVGIDTSVKMLKKAKEQLDPAIELIEQDISTSNFKEESFDIVVLSHVLSTNKQPNKMIEQCIKLLKKGGKLIILNHFTPNNLFLFLDYLFNPIARLFHFSSYFRRENLTSLNQLILTQRRVLFPFQSYQLLIFTNE